jgi:hypothetical protein
VSAAHVPHAMPRCCSTSGRRTPDRTSHRGTSSTAAKSPSAGSTTPRNRWQLTTIATPGPLVANAIRLLWKA